MGPDLPAARRRFPLGLTRTVTDPPDQWSPIGVAVQWVSRIMTVTAEMVLPGLAGQWLDDRYNTGFLALLGFAFGLTAGIWHLLAMVQADATKSKPRK